MLLLPLLLPAVALALAPDPIVVDPPPTNVPIAVNTDGLTVLGAQYRFVLERFEHDADADSAVVEDAAGAEEEDDDLH